MLIPVYFGVSVKRYPRKRIETEKLVFLLALARHSSRLCVVCWKGGPQVSVASPVGVVMYLGFISWRANVFFLTLVGITLEYYLSYFRTEFVLLIHILYLEVVFFFFFFYCFVVLKGFPCGPVVRNLPASAGVVCLIPGSRSTPGEGNGNPLKYSCLENSINGRTWWTTVPGVAKSQIQLSNWVHV